MLTILEKSRLYDFKIYYKLYLFGQNHHALNSLFFFFARYGIVFCFLSFIYLINKKRITAFLCTFMAMGIAGLVDFIIFVFWKRPRPFVTYADLIHANTIGLQIDSNSFPSSHVYIAFALAMSVFLYGHKKLGSALFLVAIFIAVGRVGAGLHYPSDVIGGALLGIASGIIAYLIFSNWEKQWKTE